MTEEIKQGLINITKRYKGKVIHKADDKGYFFITCKDIPFTRIYAYWQALLPNSVHFTKLQVGDEVYFNAIEWFDSKTKEFKGIRAIKIGVLEYVDNKETK